VTSHRPRKRFGQNFLHDPAVIERIVAAVAPHPGETLVEIGPGHGALTLPLLARARRLQVVELDRDLITPLEARAREIGELVVHSADALRFDFCALAAGTRSLRLVGNLPYNISTPLLFHVIDDLACVRDMHFMLQKEVVERMAAPPGGGDYGRLSVMVQMQLRVEPLFLIRPGAFTPSPKVDSMFVRLTPREAPAAPVEDFADLGTVVTRAFGKRRKTLRNAVKGLLTAEQIEGCGIDPGLRPERLSLKEFAALGNVLSAAKRRGTNQN